MAWNDAFEAKLNITISDYHDYLTETTKLPPGEMARAEEVLYDFCTFLNKDIAQATQQDYAIYLQRHAVDDQSEADYLGMFKLMQSFTAELNPDESSPTININCSANLFDQNSKKSEGTSNGESTCPPTASRKRSSSFTSSTNSGLFSRPQTVSGLLDTQRLQRDRKPTVSADALANLSASLLSPASISASGSHKAAPASISGSHKPSTNSNMFRKGGSSTPTFAIEDLNDDFLFRNTPDSDENMKPCLVSGEFQLSAMENAVLKSGLKRRPTHDDPDSTGTPFEHLLSQESGRHRTSSVDAVPLISGSSDQFNKAKRMNAEPDEPFDKSHPTTSETKKAKPRENKPTSNLRAVSDIKYDFSDEGKKRMSAIDEEVVKTQKPIDERLISGFKPYLFAGKYMVDIQQPHANQFKEGPFPVTSFIMSLLPTTILACLGLTAFMFNTTIGIVCASLALIAFLIMRPDVTPPSRTTPTAAVYTLFKMRKSRCYCALSSLIAIPADSDRPTDFDILWLEDRPSWGKAILNRFFGSDKIDLQVICGNESQKAMLMLVVAEKGYYIIPLVRLEKGWYITDPSMKYHKLSDK